MEEKTVYLVSACLLGIPVAYDGQGHLVEGLLTLAAEGWVVPICPEVAGGLSIPRSPAEILGGSGEDVLDGRARVMTVDGQDVTKAYLRGAEYVLTAVQRHGIRVAILRQRSPACGNASIYDGSHTGKLRVGQGVTAALLRRQGIIVWSEDELDRVLKQVGGKGCKERAWSSARH